MTESKITRREFIEKTAAHAATAAALPGLAASLEAAQAKGKLPQRVLGRTKTEVSILAFGCGSRWLMYKDEEEALRVLNRAVDLGITYLDTAFGYGNGLSETRLGKFLATRRKEVWVATKMPETARSRDAVLREFENSLKRLQTDRVDLCHLHSLKDDADLAKIEAPDGAIKALYELRDQKVARFIGMSSHTDGAVMARAIEHNDLDCVQMAMNPTRALRFEELALPAARKKNLGIILMKAAAQEKIVGAGPGKAGIEQLVRYAWSLPVSAMVIGMNKVEYLEQNIQLAKSFNPMKPAEMDALAAQLAPARASLERFFCNHCDSSWA